MIQTDIIIIKNIKFLILAFLIVLSACSKKDNERFNSGSTSNVLNEPKIDKPKIEKIDPTNPQVKIELDGMNWFGDYSSYLKAVKSEKESCQILIDASKTLKEYKLGKRKVTLQNYCVDTASLILKFSENANSFEQLFKLFKKNLDWYRIRIGTNPTPMKVTGYHFPTLKVKSKPDSEFKYPIYKKPDDLVYVTIDGKSGWKKKNKDGSYSKYDDRYNIDHLNSLHGKKLEIAYSNDLLAVSNLQVEGAGELLFIETDGNAKKIVANYAAHNGREYTAIRRILKDKGVDEKYLSAHGQRKYFQENPKELETVLYQNLSYVFFQLSEKGPYGATNTILTPKHSIAIDKEYIPLSAFGFLRSEKPVFDSQSTVSKYERYSSLVLTQDVGGAIKGLERIDFYFGDDEYADLASGVMNQSGELYILLAPN